MITKNRIYKTEDGRFVSERDSEAAFLAYAVGDEIEAGDVSKLPKDLGETDDPAFDVVGVDVDPNTGVATPKPGDKDLVKSPGEAAFDKARTARSMAGPSRASVNKAAGVDDEGRKVDEDEVEDEAEAEKKAAEKKAASQPANKAVKQVDNK